MNDFGFEAVLSRMLTQIPDDLDKREGSVIYDALAPAALSLSRQYDMLLKLTDMFFADTASGKWLDRVAGNFGLVRERATCAERRISCFDSEGNTAEVEPGIRFAVNGTVFRITGRTDDGKYRAVCEQEGSVGNSYSGTILPVDYVNGLAEAVLEAEAIVSARDEERDEELRERLYDSVRCVPFGGNRADYREKALSITGVGECVVFTASESMGAGNVGLVIADEQGSPASDELLGEVEAIFCGDTSGNGLAPIGHSVQVNTCEWVDISIGAVLTLKSGTAIETVAPIAQQAVTEYINRIDFEEATVFHARVASALLTCHEAVLDVSGITMNGESGNIALAKEFDHWQIPCVESFSVTQG